MKQKLVLVIAKIDCLKTPLNPPFAINPFSTIFCSFWTSQTSTQKNRPQLEPERNEKTENIALSGFSLIIDISRRQYTKFFLETSGKVGKAFKTDLICGFGNIQPTLLNQLGRPL